MRYWEDFAAGQTYAFGERLVTQEEIIDFGRRYDPQPFHTDPAAAADGPFAGLIASGWLTAAICMRLYADAVLADAASMGSPGMEQLRWLAPVRPGDRLTGRLEVLQATPSARTPGRGTVLMRWELTNQDGVVVLTMTGRGLFARRPSPG